VANGNGNDDMTKSELQDCVDQALDILQAAYVPEADRETLAQAVGDAIASLEGDLDDGDGDDDGDDGATMMDDSHPFAIPPGPP